MKNGRSVLLLVPNFNQIGGVSNYYKNLQLDLHPHIDYFFVNAGAQTGLINKLFIASGIYLRFLGKLLSARYSIVHVNPSLNRNSFYRDAYFIFFAALLKKKVIIFFRGWEDEFEESIKKSWFKRAIFSRSYASCSNFIVLGNVFKQKLLRLGVDKRAVFHLETTLADDRFLEKLDLSEKLSSYDKELVLLFIARIERSKGVFIAVDTFIAARKMLVDRRVQLIIAGDGPDLLEVKEYIKSKGEANIHCIGSVGGEEKAQVLIRSHILFLPTYYGEGMPNSILEGMLYAMPVISRINAAIPDVVLHKVNGYITSSLAYEDFVPYVVNLATDKVVYNKMSLVNHNTAKQRFVRHKVSERLLKIYADVELNRNT